MIRLRLTTGQLATARFAISPLLELTNALYKLSRSESESWLTRRWRQLSSQSREQLMLLVPQGTKHVPDFISPLPRVDRPTVADELRAVRDTPLAFLGHDRQLRVRLGEPCAQYARIRGFSLAYADEIRRPPTDAERAAWDGDTHALTDPVADALEEAWQVMLQPSWSRILAVLEADILHRLRRISSDGVQATVLDLLGSDSWDGTVATLQTEMHADASGACGSIVLSPSTMLDDRPPLAIVHTPDPSARYVGYPCRGRATVIGPFMAAPDDAEPTLDVVIGRTRRRVVEALAEPRTGGAIAALLGLTPATASYHLRLLYRAGLVQRHRVGKEVVYSLTDQAARLIATGQARSSQ